MFRIKFLAPSVSVLLALLLLAGCAVLGPATQPVTPAAQAQSAHDRIASADAALKKGDADAALDRLECLEKLDSLAFIRADIEYVRRAVGSANSNCVGLENATRRMLEVAGDGWEEEN